MLRKKLIFILFCALLSLKGLSFKPHNIDTSEIFKQIKTFGLDENILDLNSSFFNSIVFKNDTTLFYNPELTHYLFEIKLSDSTRVTMLSKPSEASHTKNRHLFVYNNIIYSYGGESKFYSFPGLLYFEELTSSWIRKGITDYPFDSKRVLNSWKIGDKVMVLLSHFTSFEKISSTDKTKFSFGEIDLKNFKYSQHFLFKGAYQDLLFHSGIGFFRGDYIFDSDLYSIHGYYRDGGVIDYRVLDKISGSLKRTSRLDAVSRVDGMSYLYIKDSTIYYRDRYGAIDTFGVNSGKIIHSKDFLELYESKENNSLLYYLIGGIITFIFLLIFVIIPKFNLFNISQNSQSYDLKVIEKKLKSLSINIITKESLDELFGISHYSYETIKTKRSFLIKSLNQQSKIKIERVRDNKDKRYFNYKIS
tara:strand:- start:237 stop:1493 length:1257 start_codon:yes stop_codon:yes gene_type:complete